MTDTYYVVVRDPETHECNEYYEFDNRDEAKGFILGLRTADDRYNKLLVNITGIEPEDEEGDIDSDREMQRERNFDRVQQSIETGGTDY